MQPFIQKNPLLVFIYLFGGVFMHVKENTKTEQIHKYSAMRNEEL